MVIKKANYTNTGSKHKTKKIFTVETCKIKLNIYKLTDKKNQLVLVELVCNERKF